MKNRGITLVALVITIIILLILAGISIAALTNSGLFNSTQKAKEEYANAQAREDDILKQYENAISTGDVPGGDTVPASAVSYTPDPSLNWTGVSTVEQALDYLYTH